MATFAKTQNCAKKKKTLLQEQCVFFWSILLCSHSGGDPQEDLAIFDYKLSAKVKFLKHPSIFLATYLNHVYR
jgi:hypothetical protein